MADFKDRLKELRINAGLSQDALAGELKSMSRSCLSNYEQGLRFPDIEQLETIADYFNVDMLYLLGKQDRKRVLFYPEDPNGVIKDKKIALMTDEIRKLNLEELDYVDIFVRSILKERHCSSSFSSSNSQD